MKTDTKSEVHDGDEDVSSQDIIAVVSGIANDGTRQRVWARSVSDQKSRYRLAWSLPTDEEEDHIKEAVTEVPNGMPERPQQRAWMLTERFVSARTPSLTDRALNVLETLLTLPCFSPALAASAVSATTQILSQTVQTSEGVRIEFQQLPLVSPGTDRLPSLRVIVDASGVRDDSGYTRAMLTVAGGEDSPVTFTVSLNVQGKGLLDVRAVHPTVSARRLVAVRLSTE